MSRLVSFFVLAAVVAVVGLLFVEVMAQFLLPLFLAIVLSVIFRPVHRWLTRRFRGRVHWAALATTVIATMVVLGPLLTILFMAAAEGISLYGRFDAQALQLRLTRLRPSLGLELPRPPIYEALINLKQNVDGLYDVVGVEGKAAEREVFGELARSATALEESLKQDRSPTDDEASVAETTPSFDVAAALDALKEFRQALDKFAAPLTATEQRAALRDLQSTFDRLNRVMVGNPLVYWLRLQANPSNEQLHQLRQRVLQWLGPMAVSTTQYVGSFAVTLTVSLGVMLLGFYYFLADGPSMVSTVMRLSPLKERYERRMIEQFDTVSRAVVLATMLSAGVQGLLAGFGYLLAGFHAVFLLTLLTMLFALVPFVGAAAVWGCCALWLFVGEERFAAAAALAIYGMVIVSMADNVIKPLVLRGQSNLHPLLALLSVIGGIQVLGPIGIFVGPMVVAFLQALLVMLNEELQNLSDEPKPSSNATG